MAVIAVCSFVPTATDLKSQLPPASNVGKEEPCQRLGAIHDIYKFMLINLRKILVFAHCTCSSILIFYNHDVVGCDDVPSIMNNDQNYFILGSGQLDPIYNVFS